jgi:hypothetical protein
VITSVEYPRSTPAPARTSKASGEYGLAIAYGDGDGATAEGGTGNYALADGINTEAAAGGAAGSTGSYDTAIDIGNNATGTLDDGADAGSGGLVGLGDDGNNDVAIDIGNNSNGFSQGADAMGGNGNSASYLGDISVDNGSNGHFAYAGFADDIANVVGNNSYAASGGGFDPAVVGNDDIATVFDPFGTLGSTAVAGEGFDVPGSFDLAAVFGDGYDTFPLATGSNFLVEILPTLF